MVDHDHNLMLLVRSQIYVRNASAYAPTGRPVIRRSAAAGNWLDKA
jgi:hypothetical protein